MIAITCQENAKLFSLLPSLMLGTKKDKILKLVTRVQFSHDPRTNVPGTIGEFPMPDIVARMDRIPQHHLLVSIEFVPIWAVSAVAALTTDLGIAETAFYTTLFDIIGGFGGALMRDVRLDRFTFTSLTSLIFSDKENPRCQVLFILILGFIEKVLSSGIECKDVFWDLIMYLSRHVQKCHKTLQQFEIFEFLVRNCERYLNN